jgi:uncharacterized RDD family membrane protein YckC
MFCEKCGASFAPDSAFCSACGQPVAGCSGLPPLEGVPTETHARRYAGFWLRLIAFFIDTIILLVATVMILRILGRSLDLPPLGVIGPEARGPLAMRGFALFEFVAGIGAWLYFALMESSAWQATLGKKIIGLYVTDLHGHKIGFGRASGRYFSKIISNFTLLIGYIMAGLTAKKQALHDMIAGCLVWKNE